MFDADAAGFQLEIHAIGDRANTLVLDIAEKLIKVRGQKDRRFRIEHAQVVRDADKKRFASLGVIASIQPSHCIDDMRWAEKRIGRARCEIAYNFKSFVDAGARIAFGTDWYVEPLNPMLGLYAAVTRQFTDGTPPGGWFPEERISLEQAVSFYTLGSAYAEFAETRKGSIETGKLADLVVLSSNIFETPPREILTTVPLADRGRRPRRLRTSVEVMSDWPVIFRTSSEIEARIVSGLLEANGIPVVSHLGVAPSVFPLRLEGLSDLRLSVPPEFADESERLIASHRADTPGAVVVPIRQEFESLERRIDYRFRDRGLLDTR